MSNVVQNRLIKGIVLGGLCSIISLDVSEIAFAGLDPIVKYCTKRKKKVGGIVGRSALFIPNPTSSVKEKGEKRLSKQKRKRKEKKQLYKRVLRILLFIVVAYGMVSYLTRNEGER